MATDDNSATISRIETTVTDQGDRTIWRISHPTMQAVTITFTHPKLNVTRYNLDEPVSNGWFEISMGSWNRQAHAGMASAVAEVLEQINNKNNELLDKIEEEAGEEIKKYQERIEREERERAEREKKREEARQKLADIRERRATVINEWTEKVQEVLKWYEGAPGRLRRVQKKSWDIFHELGEIRNGQIMWKWSGQWFSDNVKNVRKIEMRDPDNTRSYNPLENLPPYPEAEVNKLDREYNEARGW